MKVLARRTVLGLVLASFLVLSIGLLAISDQNRSDKAGGTLIVALKEPIDTFDLFTSALMEPIRVLGLVCEPLFIADDNLEPQPLLVDTWSVSNDGLTWTFRLKEGIKFHDGTPLTAEELKYYLWDFFFEKSFTAGAFEPIKAMNIVDTYTFQFVLDRQVPTLLDDLADMWNLIQSREAYEKYGDRYGIDAVVGTGPYMFKEWVRGEKVVLVRNPDYHHGPSWFENQGPGYFDEIIFRILPEETTRVAELRHGDVDLAETLPESLLPEIINDPNLTTFLSPSGRTIFVGFNMMRPITRDIRIRQAIAYAIDKEAVLNAAFAGMGVVAKGLLPAAARIYWSGLEDASIPYDPNKAEKLLAEAGWVDTDGDSIRDRDGEKLELTLISYTTPRYNLPAQVVQSMLTEVGIKVDHQAYDSAAASALQEAGEFDINVVGWICLQPPCRGFLRANCHSKGIPYPNYSRHSNPILDAAIDQMYFNVTAEGRREAAVAAQAIIASDLVEIPLVTRYNTLAAKTASVGGLEVLGEHPWWFVDLAVGLELYSKK